MATYVYETIPENPSEQPRRFEVEQRMTDAALTVDPETGEPVRRVITGGTGLMLGKGAAPSACGTGACGDFSSAPVRAMGPCCGGGCRGH